MFASDNSYVWRSFSTLSLALAATLAGCGSPLSHGDSKLQAGWNGANNPANLQSNYKTSLDALPTQGELAQKPWSDSYWPNYLGGIANRWNTSSSESAFSYRLYDQASIRSMSYDELKRLSPAEKYDILEGRYDYPTVQAERQRTHANDPSWYGLCHGLGPASIAYQEPKPVDLRNPDGVLVPFGSSDIKALLILTHAQAEGARFSGLRCDYDLSRESSHANDPQCRGVNAGSFHIILANEVGIKHHAFVAEVQRSTQIWNHPVYSYQSSIQYRSSQVYNGAAPGTRSIAYVHTRMSYIGATYSSYYPQPFAENQRQENDVNYDYTLELNAQGEIIGGEWKSDNRPAFVWEQAAPGFYGYMSDVKRVYESSLY